MAKEILRRLKFDNATIDLVYRMVKYHDERPPMDNMALVRRYISEVGPTYMPMMIKIKRADVLAQSEYHYKEKMEYIDCLKEAYEEVIREKQCVQKKDLSINGKDLINIGADTRFIGLYMDVLKKEWFDSGCSLPKKELLQKLEKV
jgi:tRNA nucleotidyltransferase (CCA-adding enzyme)